MLSQVVETNSTTFSLAISVAPVTDWRFYDSIYTERYMSLPSTNAGGYNRSAVWEMGGFERMGPGFALAQCVSSLFCRQEPGKAETMHSGSGDDNGAILSSLPERAFADGGLVCGYVHSAFPQFGDAPGPAHGRQSPRVPLPALSRQRPRDRYPVRSLHLSSPLSR